MREVEKRMLGRREFFRTVGAGAAATAVAAVPLAGEALADSETSEEKRKSRYQETDHVKTFYRVNQYPAS